MTEDDSHDVYRRSLSRPPSPALIDVAVEKSAGLSKKKFPRTIDVSGWIRVSQQPYGDAARGCHHRGDGPDASQRTISHNRQRRGVLVIEDARRSPWGCGGGSCRKVR